MAHSQFALHASIKYSLFMECTANIMSSLSTRLFICVRFVSEVVPCVIALLPGRSATIYKQLFQLLDEQATDLSLTFEPEVITRDFESELIKAVNNMLIRFSSFLFYLHLPLSTSSSSLRVDMSDVSSITPRAFTERSRSSGYQLYIKMTKKPALICQQLMALVLLPLDKVESAFQSLTTNHPESLDDLFEYFETFWMETTSIDLWNVFELKTRCNNNAEDNHSFTSPSRHSTIVLLGWHNRFAHRTDKKHPNIWHSIHVLQEEEVRFNRHVRHVQMGKKKVNGKQTCRMHECRETLADRFKKQQY